MAGKSFLRAYLEKQGFHLTDTGGGCTAYTKVDDRGKTLMVVQVGDAVAPKSMDDPCNAYVSSDGAEFEFIGGSGTVPGALSMIERFS